VILAVFYEPAVAAWSSVVSLAVAVASTCLVASSNYALNELLDGPNDKLHPEKRHRPVPAGSDSAPPSRMSNGWSWPSAGFAASRSSLNRDFFGAALWLWVMGIAYNVPPMRTKEWP
jgi:heme O synthase-like polyprenyltransferase